MGLGFGKSGQNGCEAFAGGFDLGIGGIRDVLVGGAVAILAAVEEFLFFAAFGEFEEPALVTQHASIIEMAVDPVAVRFFFAAQNGREAVAVKGHVLR